MDLNFKQKIGFTFLLAGTLMTGAACETSVNTPAPNLPECLSAPEGCHEDNRDGPGRGAGEGALEGLSAADITFDNANTLSGVDDTTPEVNGTVLASGARIGGGDPPPKKENKGTGDSAFANPLANLDVGGGGGGGGSFTDGTASLNAAKTAPAEKKDKPKGAGSDGRVVASVAGVVSQAGSLYAGGGGKSRGKRNRNTGSILKRFGLLGSANTPAATSKDISFNDSSARDPAAIYEGGYVTDRESDEAYVLAGAQDNLFGLISDVYHDFAIALWKTHAGVDRRRR